MFDPASLSAVSLVNFGIGNVVVFKYITTDSLATVSASSYFNSAGYDPLRKNDVMAIEANDGNILVSVNVSASLSSPVITIERWFDLADFTYLFGLY